MPKSLVIVESVAKTKTISKFLGRGFEVRSSVGHVKDLPKHRLGVKIEDGFEPEYITIRGKGKILNELRKLAAQSDTVFIATDPDREGEAIAKHIAEEIATRNRNIRRVLFNEITEKAVKAAIDQPTEIDEDKVEAQKARRVVDRLVGYQVSPILWRTIYRGLSAGRVQSVALRLICEREDEIEAFVPEEYWSITAMLQGFRTDPFASKLIKIDGKNLKLGTEKDTRAVVEDLRKQRYTVKDIQKKKTRRNPPAPFTTSTLQQAAAQRLGFTAKRTMMVAQQLYEGVELGTKGPTGLITYMRTDSIRVADEALEAVREYIYSNFGKEYLPKTARRYKAKSGAQDAHEAIRPTSMQFEPRAIKRYLSADQYRLYELIWSRFVASQMTPAELEQTTIDITAGKRYLFRTTGSVITFRGFLQVYEDIKENGEAKEEDGSSKIPTELKVGEDLRLLELIPKQHFTKPPPRYTESSLVKTLDELGIGRPSTYATIISTILQRKYVTKDGRQLVPSDLGRTVNKILIANFPHIFNVHFTAEMEAELDRVESGERQFLEVVKSFYEPFTRALQATESKREEILEEVQEETTEKCPKCGRDLIIRWGRNGRFMACTGYPECRYTAPVEPEEQEVSGEKCEKCGRDMIIKNGRFGRFLACSGYPECKNTRSITIGVKCPNEGCDGMVVEKRTRRGRVFYGCNNYPKCDFASWHRPVARQCPECGHPYLEERYRRGSDRSMPQAKGDYLRCPNCKTEFPAEAEEPYGSVAAG
jgi:DNA topoisomerase-1